MKTAWIFFCILIVCSIPAADEPSPIVLQAKQTNFPSGLAVQLRLFGRAEKKGDLVTAEIMVSNTGRSNLVVPMRDLSVRFELHRPNGSIPYPDNSSLPGKPDAAATLAPGQFFGFRHNHHFYTAGDYRVIAVYRPENTTNVIIVESKLLTIRP